MLSNRGLILPNYDFEINEAHHRHKRISFGNGHKACGPVEEAQQA